LKCSGIAEIIIGKLPGDLPAQDPIHSWVRRVDNDRHVLYLNNDWIEYDWGNIYLT
jgi:hypothetical protein